MTTTGRIIVTKAMQKCGILTMNETPTADEANDALDALNALVASYANDSMMCFARTWESFTLTSASTYTIGAGGDFNTVRPVYIADCYVTLGTTDYDVNVIADEIYTGQVTQKDIPGIPEWVNFDNAYPLAKLRFFPKPNAGMPVFLLTEKALTAFTLDGAVDLPPGWERMLIFNLPDEIAGDYGATVPDSVQKVAMQSKGQIQRQIMRTRSLDALPQSVGPNSVYTGWSR